MYHVTVLFALAAHQPVSCTAMLAGAGWHDATMDEMCVSLVVISSALGTDWPSNKDSLDWEFRWLRMGNITSLGAQKGEKSYQADSR